MSAPKYTPEPWEVYGDGLGIRAKANGFRIVKCDQASRNAYANASDRAEGMEYTRGNAARIVSCVNYCEGVPNERLNGRSLDSTLGTLDSCMEGYNYVAHQRDALAAALRHCRLALIEHGDVRYVAPAVEAADVALAKLDGAS